METQMLKIVAVLVLMCASSAAYAQDYVFTPGMSQQFIQARLNEPTPYKKVVFAPGVYENISALVLSPLSVSSVQAHGAKFLLPENQGEWARYFSILWTDIKESPYFVFEGGEFDMNERLQGRVSFNKEHQAAIFVDSTGGKANIALRDITVRNSAGDGISIHRHIMGTIEGCKINDCFRGGLTVSGHGNELVIDDLDARGSRLKTGVRIEPSDRKIPSIYLISKLRANHFNYQLGPGSTLTMSESVVEPINPLVIPDGFQIYVYNEGGQVVMDNCRFFLNRQFNYRLVGNTKIRDCDFKLQWFDGVDVLPTMFALNVQWYHSPAGDNNDKQIMVVDNCEFDMSKLDPVKTNAYIMRVYETHPYNTGTNFVLFRNNRLVQGPWKGYTIYGGKTTKTRIVMLNNMQGESLLDDQP